MKVLFIAPHPDDETIGAGGTIVRHTAKGDTVFWCVVTQGYAPVWPDETLRKAQEQIDRVKELYDFEKVFRLGFPTVKLNVVPHMELCNAIQHVIEEIKPDIIYTTSRNDINLDHRIVYDCTLVATRPLPRSGVQRVLSYEIGYTGQYGVPMGASVFWPNVFVDITEYMEKKMEAMRIYETELRDLPHPRSLEGIKLFAKSRGLALGFEHAECFELIREIL